MSESGAWPQRPHKQQSPSNHDFWYSLHILGLGASINGSYVSVDSWAPICVRHAARRAWLFLVVCARKLVFGKLRSSNPHLPVRATRPWDPIVEPNQGYVKAPIPASSAITALGSTGHTAYGL